MVNLSRTLIYNFRLSFESKIGQSESKINCLGYLAGPMIKSSFLGFSKATGFVDTILNSSMESSQPPSVINPYKKNDRASSSTSSSKAVKPAGNIKRRYSKQRKKATKADTQQRAKACSETAKTNVRRNRKIC